VNNVRLIYPHVSSRALIAASQGVVTITGTAGVEAMLLNKPVVVLGDVFYSFVPKLVQRATSVEELPSLLRTFATFTPDESLLETFVAALLDESVEVDPEQLGKALRPLPLEGKLRHPLLERYASFLVQAITARQHSEPVLR
jgi:capsule polysaccharide export protein KpsC/LpsZ